MEYFCQKLQRFFDCDVFLGQTSQSYHNLHHPNYEAFRPVPTKASSGASFGKGFFKLRLGKRSCSAPELGDGLFLFSKLF